jgi:catechol 2,3-dioxygenase-like lactoylglutathione lyase family enzyme
VAAIKVRDIAYVRFNAPDLDMMEKFATTFGLQRAARDERTLYMRGTDDDGYVHVTHLADTAGFAGVAFVADSVGDLDVLTREHGFSAAADLDGPGGGRVVHALDPNGHRVEVVTDRGSLGTLPSPSPAARNAGGNAPRIGAALRLDAGPSHVKRLGHCVLDVVDFRASEAWYKSRLGLVTSDEIALDDTLSIGAFLRCDRGKEFVDHHTLFLVGTGTAKFNHAAYEVADFDDLMRGNTQLAGAGYTHQWGIGRHILGSQIYDYWLDPWGHMVEHWTDGDLFNDTTPPNIASLTDLIGSQWGPTHGGPPL